LHVGVAEGAWIIGGFVIIVIVGTLIVIAASYTHERRS